MHIVYETINKINSKTYVGVHKIKNIEKMDFSYLGSGKILFRALEKYGAENFNRKTLAEFNSGDEENDHVEAYAFEKDYVNREYIDRSDIYNLKVGGPGGWAPRIGKRHHNYGKHFSDEQRKKMSDARLGEKNHFYGKHHTPETLKKMSEAHKNHCWICNKEGLVDFVHIKELDFYLIAGWQRGRKFRENVLEERVGNRYA